MSATLNDILFPIFLFVVYFCGVSLFIYNPEDPKVETPESTEPLATSTPISEEETPLAQPIIPQSEPESVPSFDEEEISFPPDPFPSFDEEEIPFYPEPPTPAVQPESLPDAAELDAEPENPFYVQIETIITNLSKRQSRKICQPLGIQQKCGQAEKPLTSIKTEINNLFHDNPEKVITVIQEKLPELIGLPSAKKIAS
jgi:hypothetical protein